MTIKEAKQILPEIMKLKEVPILVGHAGVGKTEIIKQIGEETGRKVQILILSQMEPGDLLGLPEKDGDRTIWLKPDWFPEDNNTILFLDEINRASDITRAAVMQLLLDRKLNDHILPDGVWVVAAMNPEEDNYEINQIIDQAFIDRFVWIKITNEIEEFKRYAKKLLKNKGHLYLNALDKIYKMDFSVFQLNTSFELPEISPTPRAHLRAAKIFDNLPIDIIKKYGLELLRGIVGKKHADILFEMFFNSLENPLTLEDLLEFNEENINNAKPGEKINIINQLTDYISKNHEKLTKKQLENLSKSLKLFSKEHLGQIIRTAQDDKEFNNIIIQLRKKSKNFDQLIKYIISSDVTGKIDISKLLK